MPIDKTSRRFINAVVAYIAGIENPICRISIEQAASMAGCSMWMMHSHLKKIKAPMRKRTDPVNPVKKWEAPEGTWKPRTC